MRTSLDSINVDMNMVTTALLYPYDHAGHNPLLDASLTKTGRVPRRYIVRMNEVPNLERAISR